MANNRYIKDKHGKMRGSLPSEQAMRAPSVSDLPSGGPVALPSTGNPTDAYGDLYSKVADRVATPVRRWKEGTTGHRVKQVRNWMVIGSAQAAATLGMLASGDRNTAAALMGVATVSSVALVAHHVGAGRRDAEMLPALESKASETGISVNRGSHELVRDFDHNGVGNYSRSGEETVDRLYKHMRGHLDRSGASGRRVTVDIRQDAERRGFNIHYYGRDDRGSIVPLGQSHYDPSA